MNNDGQGLIIIAAVIIAFVNWLSNTLKERAERRDAEKRRARGLVEPEGQEPVEESWPEPEPAETAARGDDPSQALRDFFESLTGNAPQPAPEPVVITPPVELPPPIVEEREPERWRAPEVKRPELSAEERSALKRIDEGRKRKQPQRPGRHPIIDRLRTPSAARDAVLLAEILAKPKALADS